MTEHEARTGDKTMHGEVNQCDGCASGAMLDEDGIHRAPSGHPMMICQRERYAPTPEAERPFAGLTDAMVERAAKALQQVNDCSLLLWDELPDYGKDRLRDQARAAVFAALSLPAAQDGDAAWNEHSDKVAAVVRELLTEHCPNGKWLTGPSTLAMAVGCRVANYIGELTPNAIRGDNTEHPETRCDQCGGANPAPWFAPNEDWNRIVGSESGMLCPTCFLIRAREKGEDGIWQFAPDNAIRGDKVEVANLFWDRLFGAKIQLVLDVDSEDDNFLPLVVGFGSSEGGDSMLLHAEVDGKPVSLAIRGDKGAEAPCEFCGGRGFTDDGHVEWDGQVVSAPEGCVECDGRGTVPAPAQAAAKDTPCGDARPLSASELRDM